MNTVQTPWINIYYITFIVYVYSVRAFNTVFHMQYFCIYKAFLIVKDLKKEE